MNSIWTSLLLLIAGAFITLVVNQVSEFFKGRRPKIEYLSPHSIPVNFEGRVLCAYLLKVRNTSRKKAEDLTFHLRAYSAHLSLVPVSIPDGLDYEVSGGDDGLTLSLPYLKQGEQLQVKLLANDVYSVPDHLDISFSSPNDIIAENIEKENSRTDRVYWLMTGLLIGVVLLLVAGVIFVQVSSKPTPYVMTNRNVVMSAATAAGLPDFAQIYFAAPEPLYYSEGDLAFSRAQQSGKPDEIEKYRRLISLTLNAAPEMLPESQANLYYSLGKLDLLLSDENTALRDFRSAIAKSRSTVEVHANMDDGTRNYLRQHGLL